MVSRDDNKQLENISIECMFEMTSGSVMGGMPTLGGELTNDDNYATGDTRIPKALGMQTRRGKVKKRKRSKRK